MAEPKIFHFTVEGTGEFPFDMLRHDACWPRFEYEIGSLSPHYRDRETLSKRRKIQLSGIQKPTVGRWESFGWKIVEDR